MGYNAGGTYFENHRSSGFDTVANDVSCVVELRRSNQQAGDMVPTTNTMNIDIPINGITPNTVYDKNFAKRKFSPISLVDVNGEKFFVENFLPLWNFDTLKILFAYNY